VLDLQWFAAEDEGRTEDATEHKIRKAREEEGRVAKSQELVSALMLLLPVLMIFVMAPSMLRTCVEMIRFFFERSMEIDPTKDRLLYRNVVNYFIRLMLPIGIVAVVTALFANIVQVGFLWTTKPLAFKVSRIIPNFAQYFSKTLFSLNGLFNLGKSVVKIIIIGAVAFLTIRGNINKLANMQTMSLWTSVTLIAGLAMRLLITAALLMLVLAIPDYLFQRYQFRESLRMTKQEVKEEYKEMEGDPQMKNRLRQRMRELLSTNLREAVPRADVVITNPTHLAIALEYNETLEGPRVLAKGEDEMALRIRQIAAEAAVPMMENKPLARALYPEVEVGDIVPVKYWETIAIILARVMGINERRRTANV
jgi:flagellar biosynthetic protein FlhB